jgi:hypothetical protein
VTTQNKRKARDEQAQARPLLIKMIAGIRLPPGMLASLGFEGRASREVQTLSRWSQLVFANLKILFTS